MKNKRIAVLLFGAALVFGMAGCGKNAENQEAQKEIEKETEEETEKEAEKEAEKEESSPYGNLGSFLASTLEGEEFSQRDLADQDLTVINFWALSCGPCIREMPQLSSLEKVLPDNVQLLTVCLDGGQDPETTKEVLEKTGYEGITIVSGDGDLLEVCQRLQYTPTTLFFDKDGKSVGDVIIGAQQNLEDVYLTAINHTLEEMGKEAISLEK